MSRRSSLLRPPPTPSRPPAVSRGRRLSAGHRFPPPAAAGPRRVSPGPGTTVRTFNAQYAGGFLGARSRYPGAFRGLRRAWTGSAPSWPARGRGPLTTLAQASLRAADRAVASAPLRTRPLDHARGHRYRGPGRLPGPDSHRRAAPSLSLGYVMTNSFLFMAPELLGARMGSDTLLAQCRFWR